MVKIYEAVIVVLLISFSIIVGMWLNSWSTYSESLHSKETYCKAMCDYLERNMTVYEPYCECVKMYKTEGNCMNITIENVTRELCRQSIYRFIYMDD